MNKERVREARRVAAEFLAEAEGALNTLEAYRQSTKECEGNIEALRDIIALLDAAQTEPTSGERENERAKITTEEMLTELDSMWPDEYQGGIYRAIRSLILSGPAPRVVSREWIARLYYALTPDVGGEEYLVSMLKELGIEVEP